jgi:hypothetical protein
MRKRVTTMAVLAATCAAFVLSACNPKAGEARISLSGPVTAKIDGPVVTCREAGDGGETVIPSWEWRGTIAGETASVSVTGVLAPKTVDSAEVTIGDDRWIDLGDPTRVHQISLDDDGTVRVEATLTHRLGPGSGPLTMVAVLRCPEWPVP